MAKYWDKKLERWEYLRIKKIGNFYYAYAREQTYNSQKERYLGRCDPEGNRISVRSKIRSTKLC